MATPTQMRKLALALPETEERSHFEQPDFRVAGKIFAGLSKDEKRGTLKLTPEVQATVLGEPSEAFAAAAGAWGRSGWTYVDLAQVDTGTLEQLILEAWRLVAPKKVVATYDARGAASVRNAKTNLRTTKPKSAKSSAPKKDSPAKRKTSASKAPPSANKKQRVR